MKDTNNQYFNMTNIYYQSELYNTITENQKGSISIFNKTGHLEKSLISGSSIFKQYLPSFIALSKTNLIESLNKITGQIVLMQYPDTSSYSQNYHLQFFKLEDVIINTEYSIDRPYIQISTMDEICGKYTEFIYSFQLDMYKIWIPTKMFIEKISQYPGKQLRNDTLFNQYILRPDVIVNNELADNLFDCQLYNPNMDFVK